MPFRNVPAPRLAWICPPLVGYVIHAACVRPPSTSATMQAKVSLPSTKFRVPSTGSTTQHGAPLPTASTNDGFAAVASSPTTVMSSRSRKAAVSIRSASTSASVTRSHSWALVRISSAAKDRQRGRISASAAWAMAASTALERSSVIAFSGRVTTPWCQVVAGADTTVATVGGDRGTSSAPRTVCIL